MEKIEEEIETNNQFSSWLAAVNSPRLLSAYAALSKNFCELMTRMKSRKYTSDAANPLRNKYATLIF